MRIDREFSKEIANILKIIPEGELQKLFKEYIFFSEHSKIEKVSQIPETALLSEQALADWNRTEEDEAWQHLQ